jgi:hypothetical protein
MELTAIKVKNHLFQSQIFFDLEEGQPPEFRKDQFSPCTLFVDPSTKSGLAIYSKTGELVAAFHAVQVGDDLIQYRRDMYQLIVKLHQKFNFETLYFEDVYAGNYFETLKVLLSIRETFLEIEKDLKIKALGVNNKRWKAALGKKASDDDKEHIRHWVGQKYAIDELSQDVIDAIGMGIAILQKNAMVVTLPPRSGFKHSLYFVETPEQLAAIILKKHKKYFEAYGFNFFTYNTGELFKTNALYALAYDSFTCVLIPDHRYFPQILLQNGLREQDSRGKFLLSVLWRK